MWGSPTESFVPRPLRSRSAAHPESPRQGDDVEISFRVLRELVASNHRLEQRPMSRQGRLATYQRRFPIRRQTGSTRYLLPAAKRLSRPEGDALSTKSASRGKT